MSAPTIQATSADRTRLLEAVVDELKHEHERLDHEIAILDREDVDLSPMDLVDHASAVVRARYRDQRRATVQRRLEEVTEALHRADAGALGSCESCGQEVDGERLLALPTTRICRRDAGVVPVS